METVTLELFPNSEPTILDKCKTRVLLVAHNLSGYYSLPIRTLSLLITVSKKLNEHFDTRFIETVVDENPEDLLAVIDFWRPDIIGLSVNVWNRDNCIQLAKAIKYRHPDTVVLAGGQEVSGSVIDYLDYVPEFDYIIDGEGEIPFQQFLGNWHPPTKTLLIPASVSGLRYRTRHRNEFTGLAHLVKSLDEIPSIILAGMVPPDSKQKLGVLLEASRCCPFRCSYCFEGSRSGNLRTASIERLNREIDFVVSRGGSYFHIMDPILCMQDLKRLRMLTDHIKSLSKAKPDIIFSVEAYAEHITEDVADCIRACSIIDVGLQSINSVTLREIHRKYIPDKFKSGLNHLRRVGASFNLYLICGLPFETLATYLRGVAYVVSQKPTRVFFNELCLLNGNEIRKRADEYGYHFSPNPPYQVYQTNWMAPDELRFAQSLSKAIERRYNLSSDAIYVKMPWTQIGDMKDRQTESYHINADCSWGCADCSIWKISHSTPPYEYLLATAAYSDVDLHTGDGVDKNRLLQIVGQLHLAGASRIRLHVPPLLLCDSNFVELLINRGVWHFITFWGIPDTVSHHDEVDSHRQLSKGLDNLDRTFALRGKAQIQPFVEVTLYPNEAKPSAIGQQIQLLISRHVSMITIPANVRCFKDKGADEMADIFKTGLTSRSWLKMPEKIIRRALKGIENINEIISLLYQLNLLSRKSMQAPCHWVDEMETTAAKV